MKLRLAIINGLEKMATTCYDDLRYVGVIQVDTKHVHCHLVMVDAGQGNLTKDGQQKGKITERAKGFLRRGIDAYLDEKQTVRHLSSAVGYEKRNVSTYVKKWAYKQIITETLPQFLIACLPEDKKLWRLGSNAKSMRKANRVMRLLVDDILARPDSPLPQALQSVYEYANARREREGLSLKQWRKLIDNGREEITQRSANAIYGMLKTLPDSMFEVKTPVLEAMSLDYEDMATELYQTREKGDNSRSSLLEFGFKLRSYSSRLDYHTEHRDLNAYRKKQWDKAYDAGVASVASKVLRDFYEEEEEYHQLCIAKYRHFLNFSTMKFDWYSMWEDIESYGDKLLGLRMMRYDNSISKMTDKRRAEEYGRNVYGQAGGEYLAMVGDAATRNANRKLIDLRLQRMEQTYSAKIAEFRQALGDEGLKVDFKRDNLLSSKSVLLSRLPTFARRQVLQPISLDDGMAIVPDRYKPEVSKGDFKPFNEVKSLDMHHMKLDFSNDVSVSDRCVDLFIDRAKRRADLLGKAMEYLVNSDQADLISSLPVADVDSMINLVEKFNDQADRGEDYTLPSMVAVLKKQRVIEPRVPTVKLDTNINLDLSEVAYKEIERLDFRSDSDFGD